MHGPRLVDIDSPRSRHSAPQNLCRINKSPGVVRGQFFERTTFASASTFTNDALATACTSFDPLRTVTELVVKWNAADLSDVENAGYGANFLSVFGFWPTVLASFISALYEAIVAEVTTRKVIALVSEPTLNMQSVIFPLTIELTPVALTPMAEETWAIVTF